MTVYGTHVPGSKTWWVRALQRHIQDDEIRKFTAADVARWLAGHRITKDVGWFVRAEMAGRILYGGGEGSWECERRGPFADWIALPWGAERSSATQG